MAWMRSQVEMRKVRGDAMDFYNFFRSLLEQPACHALTLGEAGGKAGGAASG